MDKKKSKFNGVFISILFIIILAAFLVLSFEFKDRDFSEFENRNLAAEPKFSPESFVDGSYSEDFETYVQDQFPFRDAFMFAKSEADVISGKKDNGNVYFGKDGWLFSIDDINNNQLKKNIGYINEFSKNVSESADVTLMVVPTASAIYKDKLPKNADVYDENESMAIISNTVDSNYVNFMNITEDLKSKSDEYIYYKTDHHWTTLGAFYAYQLYNENKSKNAADEESRVYIHDYDEYKVIKVSDKFYGTNYSKAMLLSVKPDSMYTFSLKDDPSTYTMELYDSSGKQIEVIDGLYDSHYLNVKDKYSYFLSGNNPMTVIKRNSDVVTGKSLLVIKDSFSHCFIPFVAAEYDEVIAVDLRYYRSELKSILAEHNIKDVLFLYNIVNLANDSNIVFLNNK